MGKATNCSQSTSTIFYGWYGDHDNIEGVSRLVDLDEIKENVWNLNIPRNIEPVIEEETFAGPLLTFETLEQK